MNLRNLAVMAGLASSISCNDYVTSPVIPRFTTAQYQCSDESCTKVGNQITNRHLPERPSKFFGYISSAGVKEHYYGHSWLDTVTANGQTLIYEYTFYSVMEQQKDNSLFLFNLRDVPKDKIVKIVIRADRDSVVENIIPK